MGRRKLITKADLRKFKIDLPRKTYSPASSIVFWSVFVLLCLVGIVILSKIEYLEILIFAPLSLGLIGCIGIFSSIYEIHQNKQTEIEQKAYNEKLFRASISLIDDYSGKTFEAYCKVLFEKQGYAVSLTKNSGDYGVDLILEKDGIKTVGQCKRYDHKVSISAVQEIVAGKQYYNANYGFVITNNFFTTPAINLARANNIDLIDRKRLVEMICEVKGEKKQEILDVPIKEETKKKTETIKPILDIQKTSILNNDCHNDYANFVFRAKDDIVYAYTNNDYIKAKTILKMVEEKATETKEDRLTLHFFYQSMADIFYSMRYLNADAISECLSICDKDIDIVRTLNLKNVTVKTLTRKAIYYEKENEIEKAISVCDFGIENNFLDNGKPFLIRKSKLQNKFKP